MNNKIMTFPGYLPNITPFNFGLVLGVVSFSKTQLAFSWLDSIIFAISSVFMVSAFWVMLTIVAIKFVENYKRLNDILSKEQVEIINKTINSLSGRIYFDLIAYVLGGSFFIRGFFFRRMMSESEMHYYPVISLFAIQIYFFAELLILYAKNLEKDIENM